MAAHYPREDKKKKSRYLSYSKGHQTLFFGQNIYGMPHLLRYGAIPALSSSSLFSTSSSGTVCFFMAPHERAVRSRSNGIFKNTRFSEPQNTGLKCVAFVTTATGMLLCSIKRKRDTDPARTTMIYRLRYSCLLHASSSTSLVRPLHPPSNGNVKNGYNLDRKH